MSARNRYLAAVAGRLDPIDNDDNDNESLFPPPPPPGPPPKRRTRGLPAPPPSTNQPNTRKIIGSFSISSNTTHTTDHSSSSSNRSSNFHDRRKAAEAMYKPAPPPPPPGPPPPTSKKGKIPAEISQKNNAISSPELFEAFAPVRFPENAAPAREDTQLVPFGTENLDDSMGEWFANDSQKPTKNGKNGSRSYPEEGKKSKIKKIRNMFSGKKSNKSWANGNGSASSRKNQKSPTKGSTVETSTAASSSNKTSYKRSNTKLEKPEPQSQSQQLQTHQPQTQQPMQSTQLTRIPPKREPESFTPFDDFQPSFPKDPPPQEPLPNLFSEESFSPPKFEQPLKLFSDHEKNNFYGDVYEDHSTNSDEVSEVTNPTVFEKDKIPSPQRPPRRWLSPENKKWGDGDTDGFFPAENFEPSRERAEVPLILDGNDVDIFADPFFTEGGVREEDEDVEATPQTTNKSLPKAWEKVDDATPAVPKSKGPVKVTNGKESFSSSDVRKKWQAKESSASFDKSKPAQAPTLSEVMDAMTPVQQELSSNRQLVLTKFVQKSRSGEEGATESSKKEEENVEKSHDAPLGVKEDDDKSIKSEMSSKSGKSLRASSHMNKVRLQLQKNRKKSKIKEQEIPDTVAETVIITQEKMTDLNVTMEKHIELEVEEKKISGIIAGDKENKTISTVSSKDRPTHKKSARERMIARTLKEEEVPELWKPLKFIEEAPVIPLSSPKGEAKNDANTWNTAMPDVLRPSAPVDVVKKNVSPILTVETKSERSNKVPEVNDGLLAEKNDDDKTSDKNSDETSDKTSDGNSDKNSDISSSTVHRSNLTRNRRKMLLQPLRTGGLSTDLSTESPRNDSKVLSPIISPINTGNNTGNKAPSKKGPKSPPSKSYSLGRYSSANTKKSTLNRTSGKKAFPEKQPSPKVSSTSELPLSPLNEPNNNWMKKVSNKPEGILDDARERRTRRKNVGIAERSQNLAKSSETRSRLLSPKKTAFVPNPPSPKAVPRKNLFVSNPKSPPNLSRRMSPTKSSPTKTSPTKSSPLNRSFGSSTSSPLNNKSNINILTPEKFTFDTVKTPILSAQAPAAIKDTGPKPLLSSVPDISKRPSPPPTSPVRSPTNPRERWLRIQEQRHQDQAARKIQSLLLVFQANKIFTQLRREKALLERTPTPRKTPMAFQETPQHSNQSVRMPPAPRLLPPGKRTPVKHLPPTPTALIPPTAPFTQQRSTLVKPILRPMSNVDNTQVQRMGLRLLAAAAVPIQTEIRRFLAQRQTFRALSSILILQAFFRRWIAETYKRKARTGVVLIQKMWRGWWVRDSLDDERYCATEIQRMVRGYLAALKVSDDLTDVLIVQSVTRRWIARRRSSERAGAVRVIQKSARGFLVRSTVELHHVAAVAIQTTFRMYSDRWKYNLDLVDITLVQTVVRRYLAQKVYRTKKAERDTRCAVRIQSAWRSYDCTMIYLHTLADILLVQSVVRKWIAMRYVPKYRNMIHTSCALSMQSIVRGFLARQKLRKHRGATKIQTAIRGRMKYVAYKEYTASRTIQKIWRGFQCGTDYIFLIADIVLVQRMARKWLAGRKVRALRSDRNYEITNASATTIQKVWRGYITNADFVFALVHIIISQSVVRKYLARRKFLPELRDSRSATKIQAAYRGHVLRSDLYFASVLIQKQVRGFVQRRKYKQTLAAIQIQKTWRGFVSYSNYLIIRFEEQAATTVQRYWRGFWDYSHYVILQFELCRCQAVIRGHMTRKALALKQRSAVTLQSGVRRCLARIKVHRKRVAAVLVSSAVQSMRFTCSSVKIQTWFRMHRQRRKEKRAALVIERFFMMVKREVDKEIQRREQSRKVKRMKRRRKQREADEKLLERIWLNTVKEDDDKEAEAIRHAKKAAAVALNRTVSKQHSSNWMEGDNAQLVASPRNGIEGVGIEVGLTGLLSPGNKSFSRSPSNNIQRLMNSGPSYMSPIPTQPTNHVGMDDAASEISEITSPTFFHRPQKNNQTSRFASLTRKELADDYSLEEAWIDTAVYQSKEKKKEGEQYLHRHGLKAKKIDPIMENGPLLTYALNKTKSNLGGKNTNQQEPHSLRRTKSSLVKTTPDNTHQSNPPPPNSPPKLRRSQSQQAPEKRKSKSRPRTNEVTSRSQSQPPQHAQDGEPAQPQTPSRRSTERSPLSRSQPPQRAQDGERDQSQTALRRSNERSQPQQHAEDGERGQPQTPSRRSTERSQPPQRAKDGERGQPQTTSRRSAERSQPQQRAKDGEQGQPQTPSRRSADRSQPQQRAKDGERGQSQTPSRRSAERSQPSQRAEDGERGQSQTPSRRSAERSQPAQRAEDGERGKSETPSRRSTERSQPPQRGKDGEQGQSETPSRRSAERSQPAQRAEDGERGQSQTSVRRSRSRRDASREPSRRHRSVSRPRPSTPKENAINPKEQQQELPQQPPPQLSPKEEPRKNRIPVKHESSNSRRALKVHREKRQGRDRDPMMDNALASMEV